MIPSKYNTYLKINEDYYLISNLLSGNSDIIGTDICKMTREISETEQNKETLNYLIHQGYAINSSCDEDGNFEQRKQDIWQVTQESVKTHVIVVTYDCNFKCAYCYESSSQTGQLDKEKVDEIFRNIEQFDHEKTYKKPINIFGGEPLLLKNKEILQYILSKGDKLGYNFFMPTNGYFLEEYVELLRDYQFHQIQVTLDGPDYIHDSRRKMHSGQNTFEKIVRGINRAVEANLPIIVRTNIDHDNYRHLNELIEFLLTTGWFKQNNFAFYLSPCRVSSGRCFQDFKPEMIALIEDSIEPDYLKYVQYSGEPKRRLNLSLYNCDACYKQLFYAPEGNLYSCAEAIGNPGMVIGAYYPKLTFNENYTQLLQRNALNQNTECASCANYHICVSGCPYRALLDQGSLMAKDCGSLVEIRNTLVNLVNK